VHTLDIETRNVQKIALKLNFEPIFQRPLCTKIIECEENSTKYW